MPVNLIAECSTIALVGYPEIHTRLQRTKLQYLIYKNMVVCWNRLVNFRSCHPWLIPGSSNERSNALLFCCRSTIHKRKRLVVVLCIISNKFDEKDSTTLLHSRENSMRSEIKIEEFITARRHEFTTRNQQPEGKVIISWIRCSLFIFFSSLNWNSIFHRSPHHRSCHR